MGACRPYRSYIYIRTGGEMLLYTIRCLIEEIADEDDMRRWSNDLNVHVEQTWQEVAQNEV